jgi:hypothetical protein
LRSVVEYQQTECTPHENQHTKKHRMMLQFLVFSFSHQVIPWLITLSQENKFMLDFTALRKKQITLSDLANGLDVDHLHTLTDEMIDEILSIIAGAVDADVVFQPIDKDANDTFAASAEEVNKPWTLGHVIVHSTASAEEAAAQACSLARGVPINGRSRYELPWETVHSLEQVHQRLEESRRMRHALLAAWPNPPHLEVLFTANYPGAVPVNAIGRFISGLSHEDSHLNQMRDIMRQAQSRS